MRRAPRFLIPQRIYSPRGLSLDGAGVFGRAPGFGGAEGSAPGERVPIPIVIAVSLGNTTSCPRAMKFV